MSEKQILILGLGNFLLSDEGIGVHVAHRLKELSLPSDIEVIDGGTGGFELIEHCRGRQEIIIVDAVNLKVEPGAVFRFTLDEVELQNLPGLSVHENGVQELLRGLLMLKPLPHVIIYGVVPQEISRIGTDLSDVLNRKLDKIVSLVLGEAHQLIPA